MRNAWLYCLMILFVLVQVSVGAEEIPPADSIKYRLNPVIVTATKIAGAQKELAASVSVIDHATIEQASTSSVLELISDLIPGLYITERAVMGFGVSSGAAGGISIRGIGGSPVTGVLVLRDGRPDIMGLMGHSLPDAYSLDGVERIEVVRGPASFLYGTNAMGGVINIVSKSITDEGFQTSLTGGIGTFNTQKLVANHGGRKGALDYRLSAAVRKTDGHRDNSDYEGDQYTAHFGYRFSDKTKLSANGNFSKTNLFDPGPVTSSYDDHWYDVRRGGADVTLVHQSGLGESNLKLHGNFGRHRIYDGFRSTDQTAGVMFYQNASPWKGNTATIGFDVKSYGGKANNKISNFSYGTHYVTEYAPYVHTQQVFLKSFIASAGLRLEHNELYGFETLPKAGLVYHFSNATSFRISAAKGFRSPTIRELYLFPAPTLDLEPERVWNYEFGWTQNIGPRAEVDASIFRTEGSNLIRTEGRYPNLKLKNSGEFVHTGYELVFNYYPTNDLALNASWSKLDLGNETMSTPGKKMTLYASYEVFHIRWTGSMVHVRDLYGADKRVSPLKDYTVLNLTGYVKFLRSIGVHLGVNNLLDTEYETMTGYPMPGRMVSADLGYSF
jgi:outer membrane receptor protein involved in Fe transport